MGQTDGRALTGPVAGGYAEACGLYWQAYGNASDPVLLMIRGLGSQLIHWPENLLQRIAGEGYRVVVFDNRDSGLSDKHRALTGNLLAERLQQAWQGEAAEPAYTLTDMAADVAHLMDVLDIQQAHILGGSMGGLIAQIFAAQWPERTLSLSVVFSTSLDAQLPKGHGWNLLYDDSQAPVAAALSLPDDARTFADMVRAAAAESALYTGTDHRPTDEQQLQLAEQALRRCYCPEGYMRQLLAILCHSDLREANRSITAPALVLHGSADPIFPVACGQSIADSIGGARLEVLTGWGHDLPDSMHDWFISRLAGLLQGSDAGVACSAG
ncbi:alpha/beta fold hydrolase [Aliamphritea hakodatensis]|uniref:alpha/beta fold hydrolase n=1 Tax=Aliamphritea hakodatensis TaxID=2895352 RepID=UPI0022FD90E0|nr:alpha/beta hydrolase [Aliamphritea hakodatensis]